MYKGEKFNSISHLVGAGLVVIGASVLITIAGFTGDFWKIVSSSVYSLTLLMLYLFSTLYHSIRGKAKDVLQKFDHCMIYLLIAGSYTPFTLVTLHGTTGWKLFGIVWGLALIGIVQELWLANQARISSLVIYILMGWSVVLFITPLIAALGWHGFYWLAAGGIIYSVGIIFYVIDERMRHAHGIWHLFVLGGSICHFVTVLFYVV
ncbi:PAQR family membrane homeostasis protein TrhA [Solimicrobium silvestre]|uniref:HlyIII: channel protein, hemolysin III family n=1 Tax=Solimicrobium silvestre TaxID=2099400 RepID=A0A2S9GZM9_9BURK|nr:hemolysin III family protein [Solimicrobium silvestre]PRC93192.1 hlyIII: channel protein, hemolysin III family [Solimicrobium silvestre]